MPKTIISIILLGLSLVLGVIFVWPHYQKLIGVQLKVDHKKLEIKNLDEYYQGLSSLSKKLDEHQDGIARVDSALSNNPPLPSLLRLLQKTSSENGTILGENSSFSIEPFPERFGIQEIHGSLELSGSYPSLENFLRALEKSSRLITVDNISFSVSQKKEGEIAEISEIIKFTLGIKTYSY